MIHTFPMDFLWGASCSAVQMEGSIYEDGRTLSTIENNFFHPHPDFKPSDDRSPERGIDYYHRFSQDHDLFRELGLRMFRFSISWSRIVPAEDGVPNQKGIDHYNAIIDDMISKGITPLFDLWHSDLPLWVMDNGGIVSDRFIGWFTHYAEICFRAFGDRVKYWSTINESKLNVYGVYAHAHNPPFLRDEGLAMKATHNAILAHYEIVRKLHELWPDARIGSIHNAGACYPATFSREDQEAAVRHAAMELLLLDPMMKGEYPPEMVNWPQFADHFPPERIEDLRKNFAPQDFYGINYYCPATIAAGYESAYGTRWVDVGLPQDAYGFSNYAPGLFDLLMSLNARYSGAPVLLTENGYTYRREDVYKMDLENYQHDAERISYIREHLRACSRAIAAGVNLKGYLYWSVMDCWEGRKGFGYPMGLIGVNLDTLERIPRDSFYFYREVIANNAVL